MAEATFERYGLPNDPNVDRIIGAVLRQVRMDIPLTVNQMASLLGVDDGDLTAYEAGDRRMPADVLLAVCGTYGVGLDTFRKIVCGVAAPTTRATH